MKLFTRDYFFLTKEQNTLSPNYLTTLRELGATTQQIALNFKSSRKSYFKRYFAVVKKLRERRMRHRENKLMKLKLKLLL